MSIRSLAPGELPSPGPAVSSSHETEPSQRAAVLYRTGSIVRPGQSAIRNLQSAIDTNFLNPPFRFAALRGFAGLPARGI